MTTTKICINTINDVKNFVNIVTKCEYDVDIISGRYAIDAKSIMGIFSLDLSKELTLNIHSDECAEFLDEIKSYIVK
ncbi:MAG: HPr family phosphocarrier protein [Ruminococcaceae bacterium]|nr:HPr family phosphocarrier protein [Oscillospiraceae bacterium]